MGTIVDCNPQAFIIVVSELESALVELRRLGLALLINDAAVKVGEFVLLEQGLRKWCVALQVEDEDHGLEWPGDLRELEALDDFQQQESCLLGVTEVLEGGRDAADLVYLRRRVHLGDDGVSELLQVLDALW